MKPLSMKFACPFCKKGELRFYMRDYLSGKPRVRMIAFYEKILLDCSYSSCSAGFLVSVQAHIIKEPKLRLIWEKPSC